MAATYFDDARFMCSICLEEFTNPKLIPCFHTFCLLCLKSYVERVQSGKAFECPLCRVSTAIPVGGVENFQTNFYIPSSTTTELAELPCDVCDNSSNNEAANKCLDCDEYLCDNCSQCHMKMKATREHKLVGLTVFGSEANAPSKIKTRHFCKRHTKEEIKMACVDCKEALCIVCKLTNHEHHNTKDVEDMAKETRKELTDLTLKVHKNTRIVVDNIDAVKRKIGDIKRLKDDNIDKVNEQARLYIQKVNENKEKMITDIDTTFKGNLSNLEEHLRSLEISQANMKQLAQLANCLKQTADDAGVVSLGSQLKQRLNDSEVNVIPRLEMADVLQPKFTATQIPEDVLGVFVDDHTRGNHRDKISAFFGHKHPDRTGKKRPQNRKKMGKQKYEMVRPESEIGRPEYEIYIPEYEIEPEDQCWEEYGMGGPEKEIDRAVYQFGRPEYEMGRPEYEIERPEYEIDRREFEIDILENEIYRP